MSVAIRLEREGDESAIREVVRAAFDGHPHSDGSEPAVVDGLRAGGDLTLSLVAEEQGAVIGHAAFSPLSIEGAQAGWFGLGPVSVRPARQKAGVGSGLIEAGLARLKETGAKGCVVLGDPAYYGRLGFAHHPGLRYPGPPPEYFQALSFTGEFPGGVVRYAPAFG